MTAAEIIKALECCNHIETDCELCPLYTIKECSKVMLDSTLDLINRQKAEIERLSDHFREVTKKIRAETIKEFAKFLIDNRKNGIIAIDDLCDYVKEETDFNPYDFSKMFLNCGELKPINTEIAGESNG